MSTTGTYTQYHQEAVYGILYFALISVGEYVDEDLSRFNVAINRMSIFEGFTNETADQYHERIAPYQNSDWKKYLVSAASVLSVEQKETAFVVSCDLVMAHGSVPHKAEGYLEMLQEVLGIDRALFEKATQVIRIKNSG